MTPDQMKSYAEHYNVAMPDLDETHFLYTYGYKPAQVIKWGWSCTFGKFNALVKFADGTECWTYPRPVWATKGE